MSDLSETPEAFLLPIARVVESMLAHTKRASIRAT